jgi:hypothetical protein
LFLWAVFINKKYRYGPKFLFLFYIFSKLRFVLILANVDWATLWAIFSTNSSGHPDFGGEEIPRSSSGS